MIKEYFKNYELQYDHLEIDHRNISEESNNPKPLVFSNSGRKLENWRIRVLDTGNNAMTGARVARAIDIIEKREGKEFGTFALTYGDGLTNCDLIAEYEFHKKHGKIGTVLGVRPNARFGELNYQADNKVVGFLEKPESLQGLINGGYFFFEREFRNYISTSSHYR